MAKEEFKKSESGEGESTVNGIRIPPRPESLLPIVSPDLSTFPYPEQYAWNVVANTIQEAAADIDSNGELKVVDSAPKVAADFSITCHALAKKMDMNPQELADDVAGHVRLADNPFIRAVRAERGYVNVEVDQHRFAEEVVSQVEKTVDRYGEQNIGEGRTIIIDCSSPNIAKLMSLGHLRSTVIGESLARIYRTAGYTVIRDNHYGDWGTPFGITGEAYNLWKEEIPELADGTDPVRGLYKLYARMHQAIDAEKKAQELVGVEHPESKLEAAGRAWFKRLEDGDPEARALWEWAYKNSVREFRRNYELLGTQYEYELGESFYFDQGMMPNIVEAFIQAGIATQEAGEEGKESVIVDLSDKKLGQLLIKKSDGASLYSTRDIAAMACRMAWFHPDKILYVVGQEQKFYFQQVIEAFNKFTNGTAPDMEHIYFGHFKLPEEKENHEDGAEGTEKRSGKMSTRKGNVILLEDVLRESIARAKAKILENAAKKDHSSMSDEEIDTVARQVGIGAIIYFDLHGARERGITFDFDTSLDLAQNSGPHHQYAYTRTRAIERKAEAKEITIDESNPILITHPTEWVLAKQLARFHFAIQKAIELNQPSVIAEYLQATTNAFNDFYDKVSVLGEQDPHIINSRLRLTRATGQVLKNAMQCLLMEAPEQM
jgi:arginyl-tRNA synthetase